MLPPGPSPSTPAQRAGSGGDSELLMRGLAALKRREAEGERDGAEGAGNNGQAGFVVCVLRSELTLSCHQTFQSPAWEPEEKIREPNTYCFFCSRCQVWWDELTICSPSYDLAKPETSAFRVATFRQSQTKAEGWGEGGGYPAPSPRSPADPPPARAPASAHACPGPQTPRPERELGGCPVPSADPASLPERGWEGPAELPASPGSDMGKQRCP